MMQKILHQDLGLFVREMVDGDGVRQFHVSVKELLDLYSSRSEASDQKQTRDDAWDGKPRGGKSALAWPLI